MELIDNCLRSLGIDYLIERYDDTLVRGGITIAGLVCFTVPSTLRTISRVTNCPRIATMGLHLIVFDDKERQDTKLG